MPRGGEGATSWTMHKKLGPQHKNHLQNRQGGGDKAQERLTPGARRNSHCWVGTGSGIRIDISSVIELCAFD